MNQTIDCKEELTSQDDVIVEVIRPADGIVENRIVLLSVISILVFASSLMFWLYPVQKSNEVLIPKGLHAHLTSLSNAADEITMMMELDMGVPTLSDLVDLEIAPFTPNAIQSLPDIVWKQTNQCFVGDTHIKQSHYQIRLIFDESNQASTGWRIADQLSLSELCSLSDTTQWRESNAINQTHLHSH